MWQPVFAPDVGGCRLTVVDGDRQQMVVVENLRIQTHHLFETLDIALLAKQDDGLVVVRILHATRKAQRNEQGSYDINE